MRGPSKITFVTCLLAAPAIFGGLSALLFLAGEYGSRFAFVGNGLLLLAMPAYLTVFVWLAWRAAKRGERDVRPYVMAGLGANAASLVIFPVLVYLAEFGGGDLSGMLAESWQESQSVAGATDDPVADEISLPFAAMMSGVAAFFVGLFTLPVLGALFGALAKRLRLVVEV